ncbi:MAG: hypothetical protein KAT65_25205 [Methanophagales archaeon]|nr:hypothetical protein [Methanophagales archaeon]
MKKGKIGKMPVYVAVMLVTFALLSSFLLFTSLFIPLASAETQSFGNTNTNAFITHVVGSMDLGLSSEKYMKTTDLIYNTNTKMNTVVDMSEGSAAMNQQYTSTVTDTSNFNGVLKSSFKATNVKGHKTTISNEILIAVINSKSEAMNNGEAYASVDMNEKNSVSMRLSTLPSSTGELYLSNSFHITNSQGCSNSYDQNAFGNENGLGNNIGTNPGLSDQNAFGNENGLGNNIGTNPDLNDQNVFGNENLLDGLEYFISTRHELTFESFEMNDPSADIVADSVVENLELNYDLPDSYGLDYASYVKADDISFTGGMMFKKNLP